MPLFFVGVLMSIVLGCTEEPQTPSLKSTTTGETERVASTSVHNPSSEQAKSFSLEGEWSLDADRLSNESRFADMSSADLSTMKAVIAPITFSFSGGHFSMKAPNQEERARYRILRKEGPVFLLELEDEHGRKERARALFPGRDQMDFRRDGTSKVLPLRRKHPDSDQSSSQSQK